MTKCPNCGHEPEPDQVEYGAGPIGCFLAVAIPPGMIIALLIAWELWGHK